MAYLLRARRLRGCIFAEDPLVGAMHARLLWTKEYDSSVLQVDAVKAGKMENDCFDLGRFAAMATVARNTNGCEYVAISDGFRRIRIDIVSGSLLEGAALLRHRLEGVDQLDKKLLALRQLVGLHRHGRLLPSLFAVSPQTNRNVMALRVHDALTAGASQREIAIALFGDDAVQSDWAGASDYLRLRVRRVVALAQRLARGDWRQLLR